MSDSDASKRFSEQLCRVLRTDGVSQSSLRILRSWTYIMEVIYKYLHSERIVCSGSLFEGSQTTHSDVDHMRILPGVTVVKGEKEAHKYSGYVFLLETAGVRPGYTKLLLLKNDHKQDAPKEMTNSIRKHVEDSMFQAENTEWYFSSEKYTDFHLRLMNGTDKYSSLGTLKVSFYVHGPCATTVYSNTSLGDKESDSVIGIECVNWPMEAEEWVERKREKSWPSEKMIEAIRAMPCYILPVGDPKSKTQHIEWRFAFVPAERELVWSFNDCQIQCYSILKYLRRKHLHAIAPDDLSSFLLKTIVFWISEVEGLEIWSPPKLLECIRLCLIRLQESIDSMFLPHYFLRKRNLLFGKFEDVEVKEKAMRKILEIIESPIQFILECDALKHGSMIQYFALWSLCYKDLQAFLDTNQKLVPDDPVFFYHIDHIQKYMRISSLNYTIVNVSTSYQALLDTAKVLVKLPPDIDRHLIESTRYFIRVRVGMTLLAEFCISTNESRKAELSFAANVCFEQVVHMDAMCGRLYMSTFLFISASINKAETILKEIVSRNRVVMYGGACRKISLTSLITTTRGNQAELIDNDFELSRSTYSCDMAFTSTDVICVPQGLQYECALLGQNTNWNFCLIHPVVYAQYLRFEIAHASKNLTEAEEALTYLTDAVKNVQESFEGHRALNLLGFCYSKSGRMRHAIECFVRSLGKKPTVGNAACYHLCVAVYRLFDESGQI